MQAHFRRLCSRRGAKKTALAVAHSLFQRCLVLAGRGTQFHELGSGYFDERRKDAVTRHLTPRLEKLGFKVTLEPAAA